MRYEDIVVPFFLSDFYDMGIHLNNPLFFQRLLEISSRETASRLLEKKGYYKTGFIDYRDLAKEEPNIARIVRQGLDGEAESAVLQEAEVQLNLYWQDGEDYKNKLVNDFIVPLSSDIMANANFEEIAS